MSMNCYFTTAYGVAAEGEAPEALVALMDDDCEASLAPNIVGYTGYNESTGKDFWKILLKRTSIHCDHRGEIYSNGNYSTAVGINELEQPTEHELERLSDLLDSLEIKDVPRWLFMVEVF